MKNYINITSEQNASANYITGFPIRLYRTRFDPSSVAPLHRHRELEFVIVERGTLRLSLTGASIEFKAGQGVLINSGVMHSLHGNSECSCAYVMFSDDFIAPSGSDISVKYVKPFVANSSLSYVPFDGRYQWQGAVLENAKRMFSLMNSYSGRSSHMADNGSFWGNAESACYELEVHALMCNIWTQLYTGLEGAVRSSLAGNEYVSRKRSQLMVDFIRNNYRESVTLSDIAASANISKSEASRCFQSCLHISPVAYLLGFRIEMAEQLLQNSGMTIEAIGFECGFSSASYFCKMFQQHTGMTPGQFRKSSKNPGTS